MTSINTSSSTLTAAASASHSAVAAEAPAVAATASSNGQRASHPSSHPTHSATSSSRPSAARVGAAAHTTSATQKFVLRGDGSVGDAVPRAPKQKGNGDHSSGRGSSSTTTTSSSLGAYEQHEQEAEQQQQQQQQYAGVVPRPSSGTSSARSRRSTTTTTTVSAGAPRVRDVAAKPPPLPPQHHYPLRTHQQHASALSASPGDHTEADVARVRAALADAGYPDASWADIERVFGQMALNTAHAAGQPDAAAVDDLGYTIPSSGKPPATPTHEAGGLLHYLDPSLRLERYVQLRERELESMCLRPLHTPLRRSVSHPPQEETLSPDQAATYPCASAMVEEAQPAQTGPNRAPHASRKQQQQPQRDGDLHAASAQHRRAANIVYNITGDKRFRFFPVTRTPQGSGAVRAPARDCLAAKDKKNADHTSAGLATTGAAHLTPCPNFYVPQRAALGSGGGNGLSASPGNSVASVLTSNSVSYLDPRGCTLRHKADPVKRGQQMRVMWAKDSFLSQRRRPQEAWRIRQITMAYEQETTGN